MSQSVLEMAQPQVQVEKDGAGYGRFIIEPLEAGYGTTLGNALRRILLRSLPGVAITRVRIDNVWHEFSAVENVKEDVTEIVLNLKRVHLREVAEIRGEVHARVTVTGARELRAGDVQWPGEVECVNPEMHIATLDNDDARLELDLAIERGRGYRPAEAQESLTIGEIPLDAIFTPITKVNFVVEHTRIGHLSDHDKLTIEIVTNGTLDARTALSEAARILVNHGQIIADFNRDETAGGPSAAIYVSSETENKLLKELGLPQRVINALSSRGVERVGQVLAMEPGELRSIRNFGPQSERDLWTKLQESGYLPEPALRQSDADASPAVAPSTEDEAEDAVEDGALVHRAE